MTIFKEANDLASQLVFGRYYQSSGPCAKLDKLVFINPAAPVDRIEIIASEFSDQEFQGIATGISHPGAEKAVKPLRISRTKEGIVIQPGETILRFVEERMARNQWIVTVIIRVGRDLVRRPLVDAGGFSRIAKTRDSFACR